jgi:carboxymethylenebutenolidase
MGEMIEFAGNGKQSQGYLATPESGVGPGVVVIQEWWGLVGHIKDVVDRFAAEGFMALAPDLYAGESTEEPDEAGSMMMALQIPEVQKQLAGAADALLGKGSTEGEKCGVVGFCMGGRLAIFGAASEPAKFSACVNFYGIHPNADPPLDNLAAPVLGIFAENDEYASPAAVRALDYKLNNLNKHHEFVTYPGTQHAFFNDDRPEVFDRDAAADAWRRTIAFLKAHLTQ